MLSSEWRKANKSNGTGGNNCVEVAFFKASKSDNSGANCVEVGFKKATASGTDITCVEVSNDSDRGTDCNMVHVRDSKQAGDPNRPVLDFTPVEWNTYLHNLMMGHGALPGGGENESKYFIVGTSSNGMEDALEFTHDEWNAFMDGVRKGEFDVDVRDATRLVAAGSNN
jgi:hypothetical protein